MTERDVRERDILVAPNEYAYVQDLTKGNIVLYVGPTKISLSNTERMILYREGRFVPVRGDEAGLGVLRFVEATSSQYVVLENPPVDPDATPGRGASSAVTLASGRKVVVPGPAEFPLWPGQRAMVVDGHRLREDEFLVVRVYDDSFDESLPPIGTERIVRGTDRSFYVPQSGLEVVPHGDRYVRKAWRMDKRSGLHLRVVAPFEATEDDVLPAGNYTPGQDLFLRDRVGLFFPTEAVDVVGRVEAITIAENAGIYVRDLHTGAIRIVEGPVSFLPDPTREEVITRHLLPAEAALFGVEVASRLAPAVYVPPSTAVLVVAKDRREVVTGPRTRILAYDEVLEELKLSTGRPKTDDELLSTCFLRIEGNKVSDVVEVTTADHVDLALTLSYRVSFVGDPQRWFSVEDYVGLLCDHLSSIIRGVARHATVETFYASGTSVIRDAVLGARTEDGQREGRSFGENGMWVYDVEVLDLDVLDDEVNALLSDAQRMAILSEIARKKESLRLGDERLREEVGRAIDRERIESYAVRGELERAHREAKHAEVETQLVLDRLQTVERARHEAEAFETRSKARLAEADARAELERRQLAARAESFRVQMDALAPELLATLKALGNRQLAAELSRNLSPLAILGGESIADVAGRLLARLPVPLGSEHAPGGLAAVVTDPHDRAAE